MANLNGTHGASSTGCGADAVFAKAHAVGDPLIDLIVEKRDALFAECSG